MLKFDGSKCYKGRIISILFIAAILLSIRGMVIHRFGEAPHTFPIPAMIILLIAWQLGKLYDKQNYLSMRDPLTSLYNRRFVRERFPRLSIYANRRGLKIATIILDVNDFKQVNDVYGHEAGDKVLIKISNLLQSCFGKKDIVARWGGDEFLILAVFSDETSIDNKIHHLKRKLENEWRNVETISVSMGKAIFPCDHTDLTKLVALADANMYEVKFEHKNHSTTEVKMHDQSQTKRGWDKTLL